MRRRLAICCATVLGLAAVLLPGCGGNGENVSLDAARPAHREVIELRDDPAYSVARIEAKVGQVVDLELRSTGSMMHDLTVDVMPVEKLVIGRNAGIHVAHLSRFALHASPEIGDTVTMRIRPTKSGTYTFYCATEGHRAAGMTGSIVVQ